MDEYSESRNKMASYYDQHLSDIVDIEIPKRSENSSHVFHQYTVKVKNGKRDELQRYLADNNIPSMIYYPLPLYKQDAFKSFADSNFFLPITEELCSQVLSFPIHTEFNQEIQDYIILQIKKFFNQ